MEKWFKVVFFIFFTYKYYSRSFNHLLVCTKTISLNAIIQCILLYTAQCVLLHKFDYCKLL